MTIIKIFLFITVYLILSFSILLAVCRVLGKYTVDSLIVSLSLGISLVMEILGVSVLALIGVYRFYILAAVMFTASVLCIIIMRKSIPQLRLPKSKDRLGLIFCCEVIVIAAVLYLAFPTYYMWGGRDYGLYLVNGVHIAKTGSLSYDIDPEYEYLKENYGDNIGLYPGFYFDSQYAKTESLSANNPQFLVMFSAACALAYNLAGIEGCVRVNGLITVLAFAIMLFWCRKKFGKFAHYFLGIFWLFCPAIIWNARVSESEILNFLLLLLCCISFTHAVMDGKKILIYPATFFLILGSFTRIDNYLFIAVYFCVLLYISLFEIEYLRTAIGNHIFLTAGFGLSWLYMIVWHRGYYQSHIEQNVLNKILILCVVVCLISILGMLIIMLLNRKGRMTGLPDILGLPFIPFAVSGALGSFLIFYYFVYGMIKGVHDLSTEAVKEFSIYISPLMLAAFVFGIFVAFSEMKKNKRYAEGILLFLLFGLSSIVLYSVKPSITVDHFWMTRRWMIINYPFIIFFAALGLDALFFSWGLKKKKKILQIISILIFGAIITYMGWRTSYIIGKSYLNGITDDYEKLAEEMPQDGIILSDNVNVASFLHYVYSKPVYPVSGNYDISDIKEKAGENGDTLYFLAADRYSYGIDTGLDIRYVSGLYPEHAVSDYPDKDYTWKEPVNLLLCARDGYIYYDLTGSFYLMNATRDDEGKIVETGEGVLFFGPYFEFPAGEYEYQVILGGNGSGVFSIYSNQGEQDFEYREFGADDKVLTGAFQSDKDITDFEMCISTYDEEITSCDSVILIRKTGYR